MATSNVRFVFWSRMGEFRQVEKKSRPGRNSRAIRAPGTDMSRSTAAGGNGRRSPFLLPGVSEQVSGQRIRDDVENRLDLILIEFPFPFPDLAASVADNRIAAFVLATRGAVGKKRLDLRVPIEFEKGDQLPRNLHRRLAKILVSQKIYVRVPGNILHGFLVEDGPDPREPLQRRHRLNGLERESPPTRLLGARQSLADDGLFFAEFVLPHTGRHVAAGVTHRENTLGFRFRLQQQVHVTKGVNGFYQTEV